jgi:hypothetical protein
MIERVKNSRVKIKYVMAGQNCKQVFRMSNNAGADSFHQLLLDWSKSGAISTEIPPPGLVEIPAPILPVLNITSQKFDASGLRNAGTRMIYRLLAAHADQERLICIWRLSLFAASRVQSEALTAAESLAELNVDFLDKADKVPLHIGLTNIDSYVTKREFKLKLKALAELARN